MRRLFAVALLTLAAGGCGASPAGPESGQPPSLVPVSTPGPRIVFSGLTVHGAAVPSYSESGYTLGATGASWTASTTYGNPKPFLQFTAEKGQAAEGRVEVAAGGSVFTFKSADLYASVIPIPYTITGMRGTTVVFTISDTLPNRFGNLRTVASPMPDAVIDRLIIALTNASPPCCANPMGLDNLMFGPA